MGSLPNCCNGSSDKKDKLCIKIEANEIKGPIEDISASNAGFKKCEIEKAQKSATLNLFRKTTEYNWSSVKNSNTFLDKVEDKETSLKAVVKASGTSLLNCFSNKNFFQILSSMHLLQNVPSDIIREISKEVEEKVYLENEAIMKIGKTPADDLYFILEGIASVLDKENKPIRDLYPGDCFGEFGFCRDSNKRTATVLAKTNLSCLMITNKKATNLLRNSNFRENIGRLLSLRTDVPFKDLNFVKFVGKSNLSTSFLVHDNENIYQIKMYNKNTIKSKINSLPCVINEKHVLMSVDSPFGLKGVKTYENKDNLFLLMEFAPYANLKDYLFLKKDLLREEDVEFFFANFISAVEYLHKNKIIHRDIKPLNFNIVSNGYLKINDYYTAKYIGDERTQTIIGTPFYMSPEAIKGIPYSFSVDFWCLGICLFEMIYAYYPFGNNESSSIKICNDILYKDMDMHGDSRSSFSNCYDPTAANDLITKLLNKNPNERLCDFQGIKRHPFFKNFQWSKFYNYESNPPYIPRNPNFKHAIDHPQKFTDFLAKQDKKYFYEDSLGDEVFLGSKYNDFQEEDYLNELNNWENNF